MIDLFGQLRGLSKQDFVQGTFDDINSILLLQHPDFYDPLYQLNNFEGALMFLLGVLIYIVCIYLLIYNSLSK